MQAVILAGGASSRFFPLNDVPKSLIKIAGEPIIVHTIRAIKRSGITDVVLLTGPQNYFKEVLGNGKRLGVKISYASLPAPTGMGDGLLACEKYIKSDFFLAHAHRVEFDELKPEIDEKRLTNKDAVLLAREEDSFSHYGVLKVQGDKVERVIEKPAKEDAPSNLKIVGIYFLNRDFLRVLRAVKSTHYSFEDALDKFACDGRVKYALTSNKTQTLKYPWDLLEVKNYILKKLTRSISKKAKVSKDAIISENVVIEEGATVSERATIKGPAYIGRDAYIGSNTLLRDGADIEDGTKIGAYMEIKNSLIGAESSTHSGFIGDSVVGRHTKIGALFGTANVRLDRKNVQTVVKNEKIDTGRRSFGIIIGSNCMVGERVSTMPGIIIGNNVNIGPSTTVMKNINSDTVYYTKFSEFIEKKKPSGT